MTIDEFKQVDLRIATVLSAERVEGSEKLVKLQLDAGDKNEAGELVPRQVLAGVGKVYEPEALVGRQIVIVANLEPRRLMGIESNGMLLAASDENDQPVILSVGKPVIPGQRIR